MSVKCGDIISFMDQLAPASLAEDWDNIGLILGDRRKEIKRILLCLDITSDVVEEALNTDVQLIISHHPLIFKKIGSVNVDNYKGSLIYKLIKADINVFCAHTNLDVVECGVNRKLAERLELSGITVLNKCMAATPETGSVKNEASAGEKATSFGLGAVGYLKNELSLKEFVSFVKARLEVDSVRVVGHPKGNIRKIAVYCGSFDDDLQAVLEHGADALVTGDLKYHTAVDGFGFGMCIIDAGHFNTEKVILPVLEKQLLSGFPELDVICSKMEADPFKTY